MNPALIEHLIAIAENTIAAHSKSNLKRGLRYHRQDRVRLESEAEKTFRFEFSVHGTLPYAVTVEMDDEDCRVSCDCPVTDGLCKHTAACLFNLVERLEAVSMELAISDEGQVETPETAPATRDSELGLRLREATGKELTGQQRNFVARVSNQFEAAPYSKGTLPGHELNHFFQGTRLPHWENFTIWHTPPTNDFELWLYLVHFAKKNRLKIPGFMEALTDLAPIDAPLQAWARAEVVEQWNTMFTNTTIPIGIALPTVHSSSSHELRLRFTPKGATLHWRENEELEFQPIPGTILKQFNDALKSATLTELESRSELLFRRLQNEFSERIKKNLSFDDYGADSILRSLFGCADLEPLLIAPSGSPFRRPDTVLRWHLIPASTPPVDNYVIKLRDHENKPIEGIRHIVQGTPGFIITEEAILPVATLPNLDTHRFLKTPIIPAEAVESLEGLRLFDKLQAQIPDALAEKICRVPLRIQLICELDTTYREYCFIYVYSALPDGQPLGTWDGTQWITTRNVTPPDTDRPDQVLLYDDEGLKHGNRLLKGLKTSFDHYRNVHSLTVTRNFPEIFSKWLTNLPKEIDVQLRGDLAAFREQGVVGRMKLEVVEAERDWFDLTVVLDISDTDLTQEEIDLLLAAHGKWVRLEGRGWRRFEVQLEEEEDMDFAHLGLNPKELTDEPQRLHALQLANPAARRLLPEDQALAVQKRVDEIQTRVTPAKPRAIKADMRPYQLEGFHFLSYLATNGFGGILADDMGLGKTLQTLTWLVWLHRKKKGKPDPTLVVCPKSVMDNWQTETEKFAPKVSVRIWTPATLETLPDSLSTANLHVINYNQLRSIGDAIRSTKFLAVILDEGQNIKNPSSQTAKMACALTAEHRLILSGTPIENRALDLWSLMAFVMPGVLGNRTQFGKLYDSKTDPLARIRLSSRVRPFLIRRTKSQVAKDLPERIEDEIHCEMEGPQKKLYDAELKRAQQILLKAKSQKQLNQLRFNFLTSLLRLRQICSHPKLFHETSRAKSAKIDALLELLTPLMEEGAKVLIFSQFVGLIRILEKTLTAEEIKHWTLTGDTENRGSLVDAFQNSPEPGVFLISLKAGGSGLNLTAASYVVLFDPWWNPAVEAQAIDRTHRIGQTSKIIAYRLIMKNTIEEKIRKLQQEKQALVADVLGEEQFSQSLTLKDFQFLLQDESAD